MNKNIISAITYSIFIMFASASFAFAAETTTIELMNDVSMSNAKNKTVKFKLPQGNLISAKLRISAYNGDPDKRQTVNIKINGLGEKIAYTIADNISDGFIPPKQTRTWNFDLSKNFEAFIKKPAKGKQVPTYFAVQDSVNIQMKNYLQILNRSGEHTFYCSMDSPDSIVNAELTVTHTDEDIDDESAPVRNIKYDKTDDIRINLALTKLRNIANIRDFDEYQFLIGRKQTESIFSQDDISDLGSEGFIIKSVKHSGKKTIAVTGADIQGTAYGIFRLARILQSSPEKLASINLKMKPALHYRELYEEHGWAVPANFAEYKVLLNRYLEEGINTMDLPVGWFISPEYYLKSKSTKDAESIETVKKVIDYAHSLGIKVFIVEDAYLNPLYNEKPENITNLGKYKYDDILCLMESGNREPLLLCLENPISRDLIKRNREFLYTTLNDADGFVIYFGDPGGCYHKECLPHGEKIIQYMNEIYKPLFQSTNPDIKIILTLWGIALNDTEYVVNHIDELPENVVAIQIPPTNMEAGSYLTYEKRRGELIEQAGKKLPVIIQQFYEGVGFKNGWVDLWEHPMPREMSDNFRGSWKPDSGIAGVYGSPFDISDQLVNLRIGMEWGWYPLKEASETIKEFGDEQFGIGSGEYFVKAIYAMDDYWNREVRRFHFDTGDLSKDDIAELTKSLNDAATVIEQLKEAEKFVTRNRLYFKSFTDLAAIQLDVAKSVMNTDNARKLFADGNKSEAIIVANNALTASENAIKRVMSSERYHRLMDHPWWNWWDIAKRPDRIRKLISDNK